MRPAEPLSGAIGRSEGHRKLLLEKAGPLLSVSETARRLEVEEARVDALRAATRLLALPLEDGLAYPAFQFQGSAVLPEFEALLRTHEEKDPWVVLDILMAPDPALEGRSPVEVLRDGDKTALRRHVSQCYGDGFA